LLVSTSSATARNRDLSAERRDFMRWPFFIVDSRALVAVEAIAKWTSSADDTANLGNICPIVN
jgi:hypothetical protein